MRGAAQSERQLIGKNQAGSTQLCIDTLAAARHWYRHRGQPNSQRSGHGVPLRAPVRHRAQAASDADARHALHAKLEALPDRDNTNLTLTAAELRILKEAATTTTRRKSIKEATSYS